MIQLYMTTSLIAICLKVIVYWRYKSLIWECSPYILSALSSLLILNLIEFGSFHYVNNPHHLLANLGVLSYYIFAEFFILSLTAHTLTLFLKQDYLIILVTTLLQIVFTTIVFWPNFAISGIESIGHSITRIPGKYYFLIVIFLVAPILLTLTLLICGASKASQRETQRIAITTLLAFSPLLFATLIVVFLMNLGVKINGTIVVSSASILTTLLLLWTSSQENMVSLFEKIPLTIEYRVLKKNSAF